MDTVLLVPSTLSTIAQQETVTARRDTSPTNMVFALKNVEPMKFITPQLLGAPVFLDLEESMENAQFAPLEPKPLLMRNAPTVDPMNILPMEFAYAKPDTL